jgi:branched-chain amino acid transport system substrate-binding protein
MVGEADQNIPAWFPMLVKAGIPAIGGPCYFPNQICGGTGASPDFFTVTTTTPAMDQANVVGAWLLGKKVFAGAVCSEVAPCAALGDVYKMTAPALGMKYAGIVKIAFSAPDYTAQCLQLKSEGVDSIHVATANETDLRFITNCVAQGYNPTFSISAGPPQAILQQDSAAAGPNNPLVNAFDGFPWWVNDPAVVTMRNAFAKYLPGKSYAEPEVTSVWDAFELFRKAMAQASPNPTPAEVKEAMYSLKNEDLGGLMPQSVTYTPGQPAPLINCFRLYEYTNATSYKPLGTSLPSGNSVSSGDLKSVCYPPNKP